MLHYGFMREGNSEFLIQQVVILTNSNLGEAMRINDFCHTHDISFIRADIRGVFASVFCDFGENFEVVDTDGELQLHGMTLIDGSQRPSRPNVLLYNSHATLH